MLAMSLPFPQEQGILRRADRRTYVLEKASTLYRHYGQLHGLLPAENGWPRDIEPLFTANWKFPGTVLRKAKGKENDLENAFHRIVCNLKHCTFLLEFS
jgi:hypothetical protein